MQAHGGCLHLNLVWDRSRLEMRTSYLQQARAPAAVRRSRSALFGGEESCIRFCITICSLLAPPFACLAALPSNCRQLAAVCRRQGKRACLPGLREPCLPAEPHASEAQASCMLHSWRCCLPASCLLLMTDAVPVSPLLHRSSQSAQPYSVLRLQAVPALRALHRAHVCGAGAARCTAQRRRSHGLSWLAAWYIRQARCLLRSCSVRAG